MRRLRRKSDLGWVWIDVVYQPVRIFRWFREVACVDDRLRRVFAFGGFFSFRAFFSFPGFGFAGFFALFVAGVLGSVVAFRLRPDASAEATSFLVLLAFGDFGTELAGALGLRWGGREEGGVYSRWTPQVGKTFLSRAKELMVW